jgi:hypothetical protein
MNEITIRKATSLNDLRRVYRLVNEIYNKSGIANKSSDGLMIHHPEQDVVPQSHIFIAEMGELMVGTLTFTIDNQFGLMVDDDFKEEIKAYRKIYSRISAVWRFAILQEMQSDLRIMKRLIGAAALHMKWYGIPICFLTISPVHARIYKRLMQMEEVACGKDSNKLIKSEYADVVLLKAFAEKIPQRWYSSFESEVMV